MWLEGRELWEEWEFLVESAPELESRMVREYEITERIFEVPVPQQVAISRLVELLAGLHKSDEAEGRGESGEEHQVRGLPSVNVLCSVTERGGSSQLASRSLGATYLRQVSASLMI